MAAITIDDALYEKLETLAKQAGYDSTESYITHLLEREAARAGAPDAGETDQAVLDRLKGLGYMG